MQVSHKVTPPERLLYSRGEAARLLGGVSVATIRRMENAGKLNPIRLRPPYLGAKSRATMS
jgi:hypothetical protein